jgi:hypothetical protein
MMKVFPGERGKYGLPETRYIGTAEELMRAVPSAKRDIANIAQDIHQMWIAGNPDFSRQQAFRIFVREGPNIRARDGWIELKRDAPLGDHEFLMGLDD